MGERMTSWDNRERIVEDAASGSISPMTGCARTSFTIVGRAQLLVTLGVFCSGLAEYAFLRFTEKKDSREFRIKTGGVFHSETGTAHNEVEFNPKRIAPQIYSFTVPVDIEKGQYGVLPPGAANQRGLADTGKIFTFSITE